MNIKKFAEATGLTPRALRFYEEKGILQSRRDPENKYRVYEKKDIDIANRISQFRKMGFSINEIAGMLRASHDLSVEKIRKNIEANLDKLQKEMAALQKKIYASETLITASTKMSPLTSQQKTALKNAAFTNLNAWTIKYVDECLSRKQLGSDEELQMVACSYADLILKVANYGSLRELGSSHKLIAKCLKKIKEPRLEKRHIKLANAYFNMAKNPAWVPPSK